MALYKLENINKTYRFKDYLGRLKARPALQNISFSLSAGETLGVAGASGSGKTTLALTALGLLKPDSGRVYYQGSDIAAFNKRQKLMFRRRVQFIPQNPDTALDPLMTIEQSLNEPLIIHRLGDKHQRRRRVEELLNLVDLDVETATAFPRQLSAGQRQRVVIARVLALLPELIVLDEPVSLIDAPLRRQLLELLLRLQQRYNIAYLFITHDPIVLRMVSDRIVVIHQGCLVESQGVSDFFNHPIHPYSRRLVDAAREESSLRISRL